MLDLQESRTVKTALRCLFMLLAYI